MLTVPSSEAAWNEAVLLWPVDAPVKTLITDVPEANGHPKSTELQVIKPIRDIDRTKTNYNQNRISLNLEGIRTDAGRQQRS